MWCRNSNDRETGFLFSLTIQSEIPIKQKESKSGWTVRAGTALCDKGHLRISACNEYKR